MAEAALRSRPGALASGTLAIDVTVRAPLWTRSLPRVAALCRRAATAAFRSGRGAPRSAEAGIVLAGDAFVRRLNRVYRGQDKATNVLAFPAHGAGEAAALPAGQPRPLGDVVIAYGAAAREAKRLGKSLADHLCHLVVHGMLHLMGHDHHTNRAAAAMERREIDVLARLGVADPYGGGRPARAGK